MAARGWGPLNYFLLDHPDLLIFKKVVPPLQPNTNQKRKTIEVNLDGLCTGSHLDAIFENDKLCASRQKAWEETKAKNEDRATRFKNITKDNGCLTTGKMVKEGLHCMSRKEVYNHVKNYEDNRTQEKQELVERKTNNKTKQNERLKEAVRRYRSTDERLRFEDIKALMKEFHEEGDSPVKPLIADAKIQFLSRGEPRLKKQLMLFCDNDSVLNINYEKETKRARVISEVDEVGIGTSTSITSITSIMDASISTNNDSLGTNGCLCYRH